MADRSPHEPEARLAQPSPAAASPDGASAAPAAEGANDERLATLLAELTAQLQAGRSPDVEGAARDHPDLSAELRELWGAVLVAEELAAAAANGHSAERLEKAPPDERPLPTVSLAGTSGDDGSAGAAEGGASARFPRGFGEFQLLSELGRGGMGVVYRAHQQSLNRQVALKMILRGELASPADLARFRAEAESAARLDHPRIVPVYQVGEQAGQPYFAMKYVPGTNLAARLAAGPMPPREAAALLAKVCRAVHYAHQQGVLHRDLKPSNILLDEQGEPHITDFGLAKRFEADVADAAASLTRTGAVLGTPTYMAPEQAAGKRGQLGPASDVYSLGTILYQMLTGRPPFQAASPVDTVLLLLEQDPLPPRLLNARADRDLEMIALRCLQKPTDLRYPTAAALAADLEAYLDGEPVAARSGAFAQVVARWFRETHHATVLENWGLLWMWHSLALLVICLLTNYLQWRGVQSRLLYSGLWTLGLGAWAAIFWALRRRAGPVTFVERQIAHLWAASMAGIALLFLVEILLGLPVLELSPVLALMSGMIFLAKAGMLSGAFYFQAAALFASAAAMALFPQVGISIFGLVSAACFFFPGLKYHRQRRAAANL